MLIVNDLLYQIEWRQDWKPDINGIVMPYKWQQLTVCHHGLCKNRLLITKVEVIHYQTNGKTYFSTFQSLREYFEMKFRPLKPGNWGEAKFSHFHNFFVTTCNLVKWGAFPRWQSSKSCLMRTSDQMTIGETHPTLTYKVSFLVIGNWHIVDQSEIGLLISHSKLVIGLGLIDLWVLIGHSELAKSTVNEFLLLSQKLNVSLPLILGQEAVQYANHFSQRTGSHHRKKSKLKNFENQFNCSDCLLAKSHN